MSIKLFVSDIDGTLLLPGKNPSQKNLDAIKKMQDAGIIFTIATGRMHPAAVPIAQFAGITAPIISYNGAMIKTLSGEILYSDYLSPELVLELINFFEEKKVHLQTYSEDVLRFASRNKFTEGYESSQRVLGEPVGWDGLKKFTSKVCKVLGIFESVEENEKVSAELKERFGDKIEVTKSTPIFAEIMNKGISKAAAIKILAENFRIDISEVAAIGDSDNDLPMLMAAGTGIAMGNATDEVKKSCKVITTNCEDDGFANAVEKFIFS